MVLVVMSTHASFWLIFRQRLRQALVPYARIFTCEFFRESGKASAANGVMLAPSERQRVSLPFFGIAYAFFAKISQKMDPFRVPDSGPKTGAVFRPLIVFIHDW